MTDRPPHGVPFPRAAIAVLAAYGLIGGSFLAFGAGEYPDLHIILDTSLALLAAMLSLMLWDMGAHTGRPFPKWLAIVFAATAVLNTVHVLVTVEWSGVLSGIARERRILRVSTLPPSVHLLPLGLGAALWGLKRGATGTAGFAAAVVATGAALLVIFQLTPIYLPPGLLGITRPTLLAPPFLWAAVALAAWVLRDRYRLLRPLAWTAITLSTANFAMLYSQSPGDGAAMASHLGRIAGHLVLFLTVLQIASGDMRDRILAEVALTELNAELDLRVAQRTAALEAANDKTHAQVERLGLLSQITRAIGDRQDLHSILQVTVRSVERQLPVDFACVATYDPIDHVLTVEAVGVASEGLALELAMGDQARIEIDENGLSRCVRGHLVYEPDISALDYPFPRRLAGGGLRSMVAAPLQVESRVFGVLVVGRFAAQGFVSGECEFLRQLSEHVALAAHQAQLHGALQRAYDDLRQSQQAVMQQERLRALGQMASGIAHDINNALSPVSLYAETMLETEQGLSEAGRRQLQVIHRAVEDVGHTISRMREFYRQREPELAAAPVGLNQLVGQVLDLTRVRWKDMAMRRGVAIELRTELAPDLPPIMGVESEIREALTNLIFNAADALVDGGTIVVRTRPVGAAARVEVQDDGIGMDAETRRRCLEPFFTTKGERGTGLGLAMVYGVVQRHGGEIDIVSAPGEGATFALTLSGWTAAAGTATAAKPDGPGLSRMRLLLVDDDPVLLKALGDALAAEGHQISAANDGAAGIAAFTAAHQDGPRFEAVITDLGMPRVDGRQVAAAVKTLSPATPVVLLTGWGRGLLAENDIPPHVDQVLGKPPRLREIREALARLQGETTP